jgi:hypothetical protein
MITELFLVDKSFEYQQGITKNDLEERIKDLAEDYKYILQNETEKVFKHESIYSVTIFENINVADFLYRPEFKNLFNRDTIKFLRQVIDGSTITNHTISHVINDLLHKNTMDNLFGLICLHKIEGIEEKYLIYNKHNWLAFHRYFLGLYPVPEDYFIDECKKYFPDLFLHERNKQVIKRLLPEFTNAILFHLSKLNDEFHKHITTPYNRNDTLERFSIACKLHDKASSEGDASRKAYFTFDFINVKRERVQVCCEPHLKICRSDNYPGDAEYYFYRIYFHEGQNDIQNGKILIGHIGCHL